MGIDLKTPSLTVARRTHDAAALYEEFGQCPSLS
jgi:hypothetical protein